MRGWTGSEKQPRLPAGVADRSWRNKRGNPPDMSNSSVTTVLFPRGQALSGVSSRAARRWWQHWLTINPDKTQPPLCCNSHYKLLLGCFEGEKMPRSSGYWRGLRWHRRPVTPAGVGLPVGPVLQAHHHPLGS